MPLALGNIYLLLRNTFYYGEFEYQLEVEAGIKANIFR